MYADCVAAGTDCGVRLKESLESGFVEAVESDGKVYVATLVEEIELGVVTEFDDARRNLLSTLT